MSKSKWRAGGSAHGYRDAAATEVRACAWMLGVCLMHRGRQGGVEACMRVWLVWLAWLHVDVTTL